MTAIQALEQEQKVYIAFNSKTKPLKLIQRLTWPFLKRKKVFISPVIMQAMLNIRLFFNNVHVVSKAYDYLVSTPSVSTGVSIDNGIFIV